MISKPALQEKATGENFCWQARVEMNRFIDYYELTGDAEWLDAGVKYYDYLLSRRGKKTLMGIWDGSDRILPKNLRLLNIFITHSNLYDFRAPDPWLRINMFQNFHRKIN